MQDERRPAAERPATTNTSKWIQRPAHRAWLDGQAQDLLRFHRATLGADGRFVELDDEGGPLQVDGSPGVVPLQHLLTVARTVHCYALGELLGIPGCHPVVARGLEALWDDHRDAGAGGGYIAAVGPDGPIDTTKAAYNHAFVLLAASSALEAGHDRAATILTDVLDVIDERFWVADQGASREDFDRNWRPLEPYRGANANMHLCEAFLAAADVTGRSDLAGRALRIAQRLIDGHARAQGWLLPEHYDEAWTPVLEYNRDRPDDPFRPYGATIGHSLEWSRLVLTATGPSVPGNGPRNGSGNGAGTAVDGEGWAVAAAEALFGRAVELGWDTHHGGLVYTVGWDGAPVDDDHYWWPIAEGITAAAALAEVTGRPVYETWYRRFWDFAATVLIDHRRGGWYPQFDASNQPKVHPWYGKPDLYHALQACLLPGLAPAPGVAGGIRRATADPSSSDRRRP